MARKRPKFLAFEDHKGHKAKKGQKGKKISMAQNCLSNSARNAKIAKKFQKEPKI